MAAGISASVIKRILTWDGATATIEACRRTLFDAETFQFFIAFDNLESWSRR
jgi:hypothetical protein